MAADNITAIDNNLLDSYLSAPDFLQAFCGASFKEMTLNQIVQIVGTNELRAYFLSIWSKKGYMKQLERGSSARFRASRYLTSYCQILVLIPKLSVRRLDYFFEITNRSDLAFIEFATADMLRMKDEKNYVSFITPKDLLSMSKKEYSHYLSLLKISKANIANIENNQEKNSALRMEANIRHLYISKYLEATRFIRSLLSKGGAQDAEPLYS